MSLATKMGSNNAAAVTGEMTKAKSGTDSVPTDGNPPFERPTINADKAAIAIMNGVCSIMGTCV